MNTGVDAGTLAHFLAGIFSGSLTYPVAKWAFDESEKLGICATPNERRWGVLIICGIITSLALALSAMLGYVVVTPDVVFTALTAAFTTSQLIHGQLELAQPPLGHDKTDEEWGEPEPTLFTDTDEDFLN